MSQHRKAAHEQGLEREERRGRVVYRAAIRKPGGGKMRGTWRENPAQARGDYVRLLRDRDAGNYERATVTGTPTVAEAFDQWHLLAENGKVMPKGKPRLYAPQTLRQYRQDFDFHLRAKIGNVRIDQLRRKPLQKIADDMHGTLSPSTIRNTFAALSATYRYFASRHDELVDPTKGVALPAQVMRNKRDVVVTPDELVKLLGVLDVDCQGVLAVAAMAGLRHGEIRALRPGDVDLERGWLTVPNGWDRVQGRTRTKSEAGDRMVPIFAPLRPHLERLVADAHTYALFPSPRIPDRPKDLRKTVRRMTRTWTDKKMAGLPDLHSARHTFASHLIFAGYDPVTAAEWLGHEQPSMTLDWYAKSMRGKGITPDDIVAYLDPVPELAPRAVVMA